MITEGKAKLDIKIEDIVSKKMETFYNPVMKFNRDISVLLLNCIDNKDMQIGLPLAGSGIRGIRFIKELNKGIIKSIKMNDKSVGAIKSIKKNLSITLDFHNWYKFRRDIETLDRKIYRFIDKIGFPRVLM